MPFKIGDGPGSFENILAVWKITLFLMTHGICISLVWMGNQITFSVLIDSSGSCLFKGEKGCLSEGKMPVAKDCICQSKLNGIMNGAQYYYALFVYFDSKGRSIDIIGS